MSDQTERAMAALSDPDAVTVDYMKKVVESLPLEYGCQIAPFSKNGMPWGEQLLIGSKGYPITACREKRRPDVKVRFFEGEPVQRSPGKEYLTRPLPLPLGDAVNALVAHLKQVKPPKPVEPGRQMSERDAELVAKNLAQFLPKPPKKVPGYTDNKLGERDRWLYEKRRDGESFPQIITQLCGVFVGREWEHISTPEGIRKAVIRFIEKTGAEDFRK